MHIETGQRLYGGALQVRYLIEGLYNRRVSNILICSKESSIAEHFKNSEYTEVLEVTCRGDIDIRLLWAILSAIKRKQPDLIHVHSRRGADIWGAIAARAAKIPSVITRRVDNPESRFAAKMKYGSFNKVVTISEGIRQVLISQGVPEHHIECVRSAIEISEYGTKCDQEWFLSEFDLPENSLIIGMVAQFIERKGHKYMVDAFKAIKEAYPNAFLIFFGQGPLEQNIKSLVQQKGLEDNVIFAGFRKDLARLLPCLDLLVHPALMEGLGVSLIQAAASGVPIVATKVGGIPEIVHHERNGLLVPPRDSKSLTEAVKHLLGDNRLRNRLGTEGRRLAQNEFSIDNMVEGNLNIYKQLLSQKVA